MVGLRALRIVGATIVDVTSGSFQADSAIEVRSDRFERVGRRADLVDVGTDAHVIDARGLHAIPGLINMHEHLALKYAVGHPNDLLGRTPAELEARAMRVLASTLAQGITTVRDMGTAHDIAFRLRYQVDAGLLPGPRILSCGQGIRVPGGHGYQAVIAEGVDGFERAARAQLEKGADLVKVMASHDPWPMPGNEQTRPDVETDQVRAAFDVAHAAGRPTASHVMGSIAIARVLEAGVDTIEHGHYLTMAQARTMAARGTALTPTLSAYDVQTIHPRWKRGPEWQRAHEALVAGHRSAMAVALEAGVTMVVGTDSVGSYAEEVHLLRRAGLSPWQALRACTTSAADVLGLPGEIGVIAQGASADLVLLRGDPIDDAFALEHVELVIARGRVYRPGELTSAESGRASSDDLVALSRPPLPEVQLTPGGPTLEHSRR